MNRKSLFRLLVMLGLLVAVLAGVAMADPDGRQGFLTIRPGVHPEQEITSGGVIPGDGTAPSSGLAKWMHLGEIGGGALLALLLGAFLVPAIFRRETKPGWWERVRAWWDDRVEHVTYLYHDVLVPTIRYGWKDVLRGFTYETINNLAMGVPGLYQEYVQERTLESESFAFHFGRSVHAVFTLGVGVKEIATGIGGILGGGAITLGTGGAGAVIGVPVAGVGWAAVVHGSGVVWASGRNLVRSSGDVHQAFLRSGVPRPDTSLLSAQEVRRLLGPNASDKAVQQFMRFQEYVAQKMGSNFSRSRVRDLLDKNDGLAQCYKSG